MHRVTIENQTYLAEDGELLSHVLQKNGLAMEHPCGGAGRCGKCLLFVDGKQELSCRYAIRGDISVTLPTGQRIESQSGATESLAYTENMCYALDIGTTTLALALVSLDEKKTVRVITRTNPQRAFGADIMSRISYCQTHPQTELHAALADTVEQMIAECGVPAPLPLFVSANVTMLHLFLNESCLGIGVAPYTPVFLEGRRAKSFLRGVSEIETLPSIHSFVGADLVAGMYHIGKPKSGKYNLLVDLGTNAETVLYSEDRAICTAAAAGPCFEGCGIACGMSASAGAISAAYLEDGKLTLKTIEDKAPVGICGTGLIDLVAVLLDEEIIDPSGYLEGEEYPLAEGVSLEAGDVRQLQLAKSAVYSAILSLCHEWNVSFEDIGTLYLAGGFSTKINVRNAARIGLLPTELTNKAVSVGNSSLLGTVKYAIERPDLAPLAESATYVDLSGTKHFGELFMNNILFE